MAEFTVDEMTKALTEAKAGLRIFDSSLELKALEQRDVRVAEIDTTVAELAEAKAALAAFDLEHKE